jgi:hypothetical protein
MKFGVVGEFLDAGVDLVDEDGHAGVGDHRRRMRFSNRAFYLVQRFHTETSVVVRM